MTKSKLFLSLLMAGAVVGTASAQSLKDAQAAMEAEQYDKAKGILQNLVQKKAKDGENYFYLGQVHLINDKVDSAAIVFQEGLTNSPKEQLNNIGLGIVDLEKGNVAAAEQKFTAGTADLKKKDYLPLYFVGRAYIDAPKPDYTKAIEYLTQAKSKNQKDPLIPVALGDAYVGLNESSQAYVNYRDALNIDPNLIKAKVAQAVITRRAQAYDVALEQLTALAAEYPTFGPIYRELAETQLQFAKRLPNETDEQKATYETEIAKAVTNYKKYLEVTGDNSIDARVRYADFLVFGQEYAELKTVAQQLENAPGIDAKVYRYLGYIAVNQDEDYQKAVGYFDKLFAESDTSRLIDYDYLFSGLSYIETGNVEKGLANLKTALAKNAEMMPEIGSAGMIAYGQGKYEVASGIFNIPASQKGTDYFYEANFFLGDSNFRAGVKKKEKGEDPAKEFDAALKAFDVIIKSNDQKVNDEYLARALYLTGYVNISLDNVNPEEADQCQGLFVPAFTQLIQVLKDKEAAGTAITDVEKSYLVDAHNYIGYYQITQEQYDAAMESFQNTVKLSPADEFANAYIEYLES
ncbi:tetratricopeptide repeat protein [Sphingobacterium alkalisoli]|uniref:Tetratricopeptide repeat protein n=1 Tax=Sphingobacterium alkalisoli TaxID=1874115 RepID=A0A4U0GS82_9SPHI|nr:tetratricopeptide repeat protein [Sphingobacterium alkalisoli]TJY61314.1 tetratricopeptide repeat protein [Sphingobacterium alkalisoli]GGH31024.1 hypothetical protein GCM10011418_43520 [Sphingobacterium alkalisoli]